MNTKKSVLIWATCMTLTYSASAFSGLPEACFKTKFDYEIYLKYEFDKPDPPAYFNGPGVAAWMQKSYEHGPAQKQTVTITTKEISVNGKLYMDASESTTPSGVKNFLWQAIHNKAIMDTASKFILTPAGQEYLFNLTVHDPVCETKATEQITLRIH